MPDVPSPSLDPAQVACLERLLKAGFQFITFEQFARYPAVEKGGFVALLDISHGKVRQFGSAGYRLGEGIGVLIERAAGKFFVWKDQTVAATPELLKDYQDFTAEIRELLEETPSPQ